MSLKSVVLSLALVAAPVAVFAATQDSAPATSAPTHSFARHGGGGDSLMSFLHSAHLSADQQTQVKTILHASHTNMRPLSQQRRQIHEQIADLLLKPGAVDSAQLAALVQKDEAIGKQLAEQHLQTAVAVRNVLTADQLAKVAATRTQMQTLHSQMHDQMQQQ